MYKIMKYSPKVGIVIVNWNNFDDTSECLQSIFQFEYKNILIVIVDNGSTDDSLQRLQDQYPDVTFITSPSNLGFGRGNNLGINYCLEQGVDYALLLNDDVVCPPNFIDGLLECFESNQDAGIVGPKVYYYDPSSIIWAAGGKIHWLRAAFSGIGMNKKDDGQFEKLRIVDYVPGAAMMVSTSVFDKVGLFPECYFLAGEEADLAVLAKKAGFKVLYTPKVSCLHKVGYSRQRNYPMVYNRFRNSLLFKDRHLPPILRWGWLFYQFFYLGIVLRAQGIIKKDQMLKTLPFLYHLARVDHRRYDAVFPEHLEAVRIKLKDIMGS